MTSVERRGREEDADDGDATGDRDDGGKEKSRDEQVGCPLSLFSRVHPSLVSALAPRRAPPRDAPIGPAIGHTQKRMKGTCHAITGRGARALTGGRTFLVDGATL